MALANQRNDHACGGNDSIALSLKAAIVTTAAGKTKKPRINKTASFPQKPSKRWYAERGMSMRPDIFKRARRQPQQRQDHDRQRQAGNAQACGKREIETCKTKLIHQVRDHVDPTTTDQLWSGER